MNKLVSEVKELLTLAGYEPISRRDSVEFFPLLKALCMLSRRDKEIQIDVVKLKIASMDTFMISMAHLFFDINVPYEPGFFWSLQTNYQVAYLIFQNNLSRFKKVEVEPLLPELTQDEVLDLCKSVTLKDVVIDYVELGLNSASVPVLKQDYSNPFDNYEAFAYRLPLMISLISKIPEYVTVYAPGDGVGVVSMACVLLNRKYYTSEPNSIGQLARELGIISCKDTAEQFVSRLSNSDREPYIVILSNISIYTDISVYCEKHPVLVLEARCFFSGSQYLKTVKDSDGRLWTNTDVQFVVCRKQAERLPKYDKLLPSTRLKTSDPRAYVELVTAGYDVVAAEGSELSQYVPEGDGVGVSYNFMNQSTNNDFVLAYRKFSSWKSGRPGQYSLTYGNWYEYNRERRPRRVLNGFKIVSDKPYMARSILRGHDFNLDENVKKIVVKFDPTVIRYAYSNEILIPVRVTSVSQQDGSYVAIVTRCWEEGKQVYHGIQTGLLPMGDDND